MSWFLVLSEANGKVDRLQEWLQDSLSMVYGDCLVGKWNILMSTIDILKVTVQQRGSACCRRVGCISTPKLASVVHLLSGFWIPPPDLSNWHWHRLEGTLFSCLFWWSYCFGQYQQLVDIVEGQSRGWRINWEFSASTFFFTTTLRRLKSLTDSELVTFFFNRISAALLEF